MRKEIKVMIVDDSLLTRKVLSDIIEKTPGLKLAGTANDGKYALAKIPFLKPDIITMDVMMPKVDGITALQEIMKRFPTPVIMVSAVTKEAAKETITALESGAVDFVTKPTSDNNIDEIADELTKKIIAASDIKLSAIRSDAPARLDISALSDVPKVKVDQTKKRAQKIVAIGISTGGPKALKMMFDRRDLDPSLCIVIVQHMPETFTGAFATRLNQVTNLLVKEASDGDPLLEGHIYIAPGHSHVRIARKNEGYSIKLGREGKVSGHMPSADALFMSVASELGSKAVGVIMTGMGRDGADGIKMLKKYGAYTIAQDEATSVVYGMNKEAIKLGCIDNILPLEQIADCFTDYYKKL